MVLKDGAVMSKSKGNVVDPDEMLERYGADTLRLYMMFVAPPEHETEWSDAGIEGSARFLARVWRLVNHWAPAVAVPSALPFEKMTLDEHERALRRKAHDTIRRVTADIDRRQQFNTAVSALMELVNSVQEFSEQQTKAAPGAGVTRPIRRHPGPSGAETVAVLREAVEVLVLLLSPFAPHTAEELWEILGKRGGLTAASWPDYDPVVAESPEIVVPVQVNGKLRAQARRGDRDGRGGAPRGRAGRPEGARRTSAGRTVRKVIVAPGKRGTLVSVIAN